MPEIIDSQAEPPSPAQCKLLGREGHTRAPTFCRICKHHVQQGSSAEQSGQAQETPVGCITTEGREEKKLQKVNSQRDKNTLVPGALFH